MSDAEIPETAEGLNFDPAEGESVDARLAAIEMAGEEAAIGWKATGHPAIAPEVRFLHASRTIHELITDRNRSVGIFLLVASVLINASVGLLKVDGPLADEPIVPLRLIRYWCLPVTFVTLAALGAFTSLLLIRARIGLIYEVTKMNVLLGLPSTRVERVNPLSIFYLSHLLIVALGAASAGFTWGMLRRAGSGPSSASWQGLVVGLGYAGLFQALYYLTILRATSETKLRATRG